MKKILYIGNKLSQHGFNATTIETLGKLFESEGYRVVYSSSQKNQILRLLDMIFTTIKRASKVDYIIIDTYSTSSFWYVFFCSQLARLFKTNYIPILHGGNLPVRLQQNPKISKMIFSNSFVNVAPSNYLRKAFLDNGFTNTIFIPNVVEKSDYTFQERTSIEPKLLWVRAFAKLYNPIMGISVLLLVQKKYPNATLTMVGPDKDGMLETAQQFAIANNIKVNFTGKLTKNQWIEIAKKNDIFINTTHVDNTPVSVMEAMLLGLPVVSTNVGGIPFLIEDHKDGLLVPDNDAVGMANKIDYLIQNPQIGIQIAQNACQKVASFDWNHVKILWNKLLV